MRSTRANSPTDDHERTVTELDEVFADPLFRNTPCPASNSRDRRGARPGLVDAVTPALPRLSRPCAARGRCATPDLDDRDRAEGAVDNPVDRVRDHIQEAKNYFPDLDEAAESLAAELQAHRPRPLLRDLRSGCARSTASASASCRSTSCRTPCAATTTIAVSCSSRRSSIRPGRTFQAAYQLAFAEMRPMIDALAARLEPEDGPARRLLRISLGNYFAGALMMPYGRFHAAAEALRYDVDVLGARFGASFEQVAHRLTTLARPGARGVPFFLVRVDSAGNVSKRFSSGRFPFSQYGGTCPLWNVHATFRTPAQILTQIVELPDNSRWFSIARAVRRASNPWGMPDPQFVVGLGCELKYAGRLVYARGFDLAAPDPTPIGINCRLCERVACPQRAAPPLMHPLIVDEMRRGVSPFEFDAT